MIKMLRRMKCYWRDMLFVTLILPALFPAVSAAGEDGGGNVVAGYKGNFFLRTDDGRFDFNLGGRVTAHAWLYQEGSTPSSELFLTRVRVWMNATVWKYYTIRIQNEFVSGPSLRDAYVDIHYTQVARVRIGQFKVPFSLEELYSHRYIDLVERPSLVQSDLLPARDVGIMLHGKLMERLFEYQIALLSGSGQNTHDKNKDKDFAGRIMLSPFRLTDLSLVKDLSFGVGVTYGNQSSTSNNGVLKGNSIRGNTPTGFHFYAAVPVNGERIRLDAQLAWLAGPASLKGEFIHTSEERKGVVVNGQENLDDFETEGWYVTASWILTGEKETMKRPTPKRPFFWSNGSFGPGLVKLATRYEVFDLDKENSHAAAEPSPMTFRAWTFGVTWYPVSLIRISVNYQWEYFSDPERSLRPGHKEANVIMARFQAEF